MTIKTAPGTDNRLLPLAAALVTVLLWASAFVAIRYVGRELSAGALSLGRLIVAAVVLGLMMLLDDRRAAAPTPWPSRRHWPRLLTVGVIWFGLYNIALNQAERLVDAGTAAMLVNVGPLLIAILAGLLLGEGFPRSLITGSLIAFAGVVLIGTATSTTAGVDMWGVVLCLVAAVSYAVGVVAQKPLLAELSGLRVTWLACVIGAVCCLPYAPALVRELGAAQPSTVGWLVYLGVFPTALGFTTWAYALARTTAGKLGATTYLVPAVAIVMAWVLLGEVPPVLALAGGALCLAGVALSRRTPRTR
ncbi:DMT family transporter [Catellatospora vulcania]|uniref:DMT family transporter n=1 Tax=Catellatospora vulcania TaxID=1460450 RepID=UPI0012D3B7ED|nr:DMT family transporter [Catellatospora vulcania]